MRPSGPGAALSGKEAIFEGKYVRPWFSSYQFVIIIMNFHYNSSSLSLTLHIVFSVSVLSVKTKTIPAWDQTLAGRVRDGMTLQGTYVHTSSKYSV